MGTAAYIVDNPFTRVNLAFFDSDSSVGACAPCVGTKDSTPAAGISA